MTLDQVKALPVANIAAEDCALLLWVTDPMLSLGIEVMAAWGFTYKTVAFTWVKCRKDGTGFPIGCGYWTRANPEMCLLGTRGAPKRDSKDVRQLIIEPRREHSRKPARVRTDIERLLGDDIERIELFAREQATGWDAWGTAVNKVKPSKR